MITQNSVGRSTYFDENSLVFSQEYKCFGLCSYPFKYIGLLEKKMIGLVAVSVVSIDSRSVGCW